MKQYDIAVVIGRFQPVHKGHMPAFKKAEQIAHKTVCVIGSTNKPSTPKNPFSFDERRTLISLALQDEGLCPIEYAAVEDSFYREQEWYRHVKEAVYATSQELQLHGNEGVRVAVLGYKKDASSYYLDNFSDWDFVEIDGQNGGMNPFSATFVRKLWYENDLFAAESFLHSETYFFLKNYEWFKDLQEDYLHVKQYDPSKFAIQMLTTDAVVVHGDEVLLIRRGCSPGKGQWALPGGFVDKNETFFNASVRELREETRIDVPEKVIVGSKRDEHMFDFPKRSSRGRTVSMAYLFVLDPSRPRPRVKGGDDAVMAWWFSLAEVKAMRDQLYEDHPDIIEYMTARL